MKANIWKILTIVCFIICVVEFIWAFSYIKNKESETTIEITKLRMKIAQDSMIIGDFLIWADKEKVKLSDKERLSVELVNDSLYGEKVKKLDNTPLEKTISTTQQQQNLVNKGYFIGTTGPNKNGVDGVPNEKTRIAQHAFDSGIEAVTFNNISIQQKPELATDIERIFGKPQVKKSTVIKIIHPKDW
jgi:hypothetical protein